MTKKSIKKHDLKKLFKEIGSVHKMADILGVSPSTVYYYIDKYEIDISRDRFPYNKEELLDLHSKYGSISRVAANLSRSYSTVRYWYSSLNIVKNESGMNIFKEIRNTPMSDIQKSALIGSMLGDGGIWLAPHSKNARLYVSHCEKQLGYLKWLHDLFNPFSRPITQTEKAGKKIICGREVNNSNFYRFYTIAHPDITHLLKLYYRKGLKGVDETIINKIDLLSMSIWFADDGSIERNKKGEPVSCSICTNSFSYKENKLLIEAVRKFFKGTIKIVQHRGRINGVKREDYMIRMYSKKYVNDFLDMIKIVLPECIHYKLS